MGSFDFNRTKTAEHLGRILIRDARLSQGDWDEAVHEARRAQMDKMFMGQYPKMVSIPVAGGTHIGNVRASNLGPPGPSP